MAHLFYFRRLLGAVQAGAHSNGMRFLAVDGRADRWRRASITRSAAASWSMARVEGDDAVAPAGLPHPFRTGADLLGACRASRLSIAQVVLRNECARRTPSAVRAGLLDIWSAMSACVERAAAWRASCPALARQAPRARVASPAAGPVRESLRDPLAMLDWVNLYAMAVNEERRRRVVTAPTNGAAGVIPAVLHYYARFVPGANDDGIVDFLLTAAAIGAI